MTPGDSEVEISAAKWQDLEALWKAILGIEAAMDNLRASIEGLAFGSLVQEDIDD